MSRHPVFMVEAYRPTLEGARVRAEVDGTVVGVIDIPDDEIALVLVSASDAAAADRVVRDRGLQPIRVVDVRWEAVADTGQR